MAPLGVMQGSCVDGVATVGYVVGDGACVCVCVSGERGEWCKVWV